MQREHEAAMVGGEPTVLLPTRTLVQLIDRAFAPPPALETLGRLEHPRRQGLNRILPAIGAEIDGGKFAGVTLDGGELAKLILLPGEADSINWKDAGAWAETAGGVLPSRHDGIVLFENLKSEFKDAWYWLDAQHAGESGYAWCQGFGYGGQSWSHVSATAELVPSAEFLFSNSVI